MRKYYYLITPSGNKAILFYENDTLYSFIENADSYLVLEYNNWVAEGNEAEPWDPENLPV